MYRTSKNENEILTRTGRGTPMGEFLRRYWWPIGISAHLKTKPTFIRVFGEDLVLFRGGNGSESSVLTAPIGAPTYVSVTSRETVCAVATMAGSITPREYCSRLPASPLTASSKRKRFACRPIPWKSWVA